VNHEIMHNDSNYVGATLAVALNLQIGELQNEINVLPLECFQAYCGLIIFLQFSS